MFVFADHALGHFGIKCCASTLGFFLVSGGLLHGFFAVAILVEIDVVWLGFLFF